MSTPLPRRWAALFCAVMLALMGAQAAAQAPADFKGETISIEIGYGAGGGYDTYGRILARHFGRLIPGNPNVVAKNMPGAGSLRAANFIYNLAPKDGSELGIFASSTAMEPLMGNEQAKFDATRFSWIGSMNQDISFCGLWQGLGAATSFDELMKKRRQGCRLRLLAAPPPSATSTRLRPAQEHPRRQYPRDRRL